MMMVLSWVYLTATGVGLGTILLLILLVYLIGGIQRRGRNFTHTGVGASTNTSDDFKRPLAGSIRRPKSVLDP